MRLSKKARYFIAAAAGLLLMAASVPLAIWITHTSSAELGNSRSRCNRSDGTVHKIIIKNDTVLPSHTDAKKCDTLTIINLDDRQRLMAFGRHENHISYDGISERLVGKGQSLTVRLITTGTFLFHDHAQDGVNGDFTVQ